MTKPASRSLKKTVVLKMYLEFGSGFQKDSALDSLALMIKAWTLFYERQHKKNKIKYDLVEESE